MKNSQLKIALLIFLPALLITTVAAQPVREDLWVTNGSVKAMVEYNGVFCIGGAFTSVGPNTGTLANIVFTIAGAGKTILTYGTSSGLVTASAEHVSINHFGEGIINAL